MVVPYNWYWIEVFGCKVFTKYLVVGIFTDGKYSGSGKLNKLKLKLITINFGELIRVRGRLTYSGKLQGN